MRLVVYIWEDENGLFCGETCVNNKIDFRGGFPNQKACSYSFLGTYARGCKKFGYSSVTFRHRKRLEDEGYTIQDLEQTELDCRKLQEDKAQDKTETPSEPAKRYIYKKEGNRLTIYEKVLVQEYPL